MAENGNPKAEDAAPQTPDAAEGEVVQAQETIPRLLPVLPLGDVVFFPGMVAPLIVNTPRTIKMIDDVVATSRYLLCVLQKDREMPDDQVTPDDLHAYGCLGRLIKMLRFPDESTRILIQGVARCKITWYDTAKTYLSARYAILRDEIEDSIEIQALTRNASQRFQEIVSLSPAMPDELKIAAFNIASPGRLADLIGSNLNMTLEERQQLLEDYRPKSRLEKLTALLNRELEVLHLGSEIQTKVSETLSKTQREFFLREQLKAIKGELGEEDQQQADIRQVEEKIAKAKMPKEVEDVAHKEKSRLQSIPPASPEYAVVRTYLDWLTELPWSVQTEDMLDIRRAKRILDDDHYDLVKIKDRILEYLAVLKLKHDMKGPILCFVGPPGVGKTSLGQSIARALGRKFIRMSLGGVHDEAEIRGHRRTYIGALPGRIIQGLRRAGTRNPVFMLDEVDKIGADFRGDPSSALLEVLDPEQNFSFSDHYLDVPFDLSTVLFITTCNVLDTVPPALRDRMEVLELAGYTLVEKVHIARKFLVPKQIKSHGLKPSHVSFPKESIETIISAYTREAGVRNLEREIANICRKVARGVAEGRGRQVQVTPARVHGFLGARKFESEVAERTVDPGVVTGLAWTPTGGDILFVEVTRMPGKGQLILTGSLGEIMKESARAALSYVRANQGRWPIPEPLDDKVDLHIHVPAGAIPKDGPSAGLAMTIALVSLLTRKPLGPTVAMTGEITLRGKVMPVGGIKEKVLAASRAGIKRVVLPQRNRHDLDEIPREVRCKVQFKFVKDIDEAIRATLNLRRRSPEKKMAGSK
ncbi:MAG: endopeptidase La [Kiritimatiellae bacterium]|nr:endopeptidase La [Kiritimatiellia bacterium]